MLMDFKKIQFDKYNRIAKPTMILKTMAGTTICPITNYYNLKANFKFNDVSEITFNASSHYDVGDKTFNNPCFKELTGMRTIEVEPYGTFVLINPEEDDDGLKHTKECTAYSLEYELNFKTMPALNGTFKFHDPINDEELLGAPTITKMIIEAAPNWKIGSVDIEVASRHRTFDNSPDNLYSTMMSSLQESYECIFVFDNRTRTINVLDAKKQLDNLPIWLSKENLVKSVHIDELSDEVVTVLGVYGADDISIESVNPLGNSKVYNLDYFIANGDIPKELADKWRKWSKNLKTYQKIFSNLAAEYYRCYLLYQASKTHLEEIKAKIKQQESIKGVLEADSEITQSGKQQLELAIHKIKVLIKERDEYQKIVDANEKRYKAIYDNNNGKHTGLMADVHNICSFENNFEEYELSILNAFFKEDTLQDTTFVLSEANSEDAVSKKIELNQSNIENGKFKLIDREVGATLSITDAIIYSSDDYKKLTGEELAALQLGKKEMELLQKANSMSSSYLGCDFYTIKNGKLDLQGLLKLNGKITNSTIAIAKPKKGDVLPECTITLNVEGAKVDDKTYDTSTFIFFGRCYLEDYKACVSGKSDGKMRLFLAEGLSSFTGDLSFLQNQQTIQELYEFGIDSVNKLAFPAYQFKIDSTNWIFNEEFEPFKNNLKLGGSINLQLTDEIFRRPILTGVELDFEDESSFQLTYSDKFRSNDSEFKLAEMIGKSQTTAANLDASKFSYKAFSNSKVKNSVEELIKNDLDLSTKAIKTAEGQLPLMDGSGIHLRKEGSLNEIRLINNRIVFTDDGWKSARMALGEMSNGSYGIVAESIVGKVIAGNNLTIEATRDPGLGGAPITTFRVDSNGVLMQNGKLVFETPSAEMLIDPEIGLAAGRDIFDRQGEQCIPHFLDSSGNLILDEKGFPKHTNLLYDAKRNKLFVRGDIYAENGYFAGVIEMKDNSGDAIFKVDKNGKLIAKAGKISCFDISKEKFYFKGGAGNMTIGLESGIPFFGYADKKGNGIKMPTLSADIFFHKNGSVRDGIIHAHDLMLKVYRLIPDVTGKAYIGGSSIRWEKAYFKSAPNISSDKRGKKNISEINLNYINIFDSITPVTYMRKDTDDGVVHTGFIAQDVVDAVKKIGLDYHKFGLVDAFQDDAYGKMQECYALCYEEFIALNTAKIKQLEKRIQELEKRSK